MAPPAWFFGCMCHLQMENKRLRHVVKALYRRCTASTSAADDQKEAMKEGVPMPSLTLSSASPLLSLPVPSPLLLPTPAFTLVSSSEMSVGRGRQKRPKAWETSIRPKNDPCEVCAEQPPRKKELLFGGCLHGMCRSCTTAHLKARRRCCHVCQVDFQDRLLELGVQVSIKHVLAESEKLSKKVASCKPRAKRKIS